MTQAEAIADQFDNDGQCFTITVDGKDFNILRLIAIFADHKWDRGDGVVVWILKDNSKIVTTDNFWDLVDVTDDAWRFGSGDVLATLNDDDEPIGFAYRF